ncbi:helix-turn-helix domain-containing protein [Maribellus sediminis]|uniref:helix-turn-helix domain-containing protein n=1 Tax=Maribellus sediminis TaxID=2696285 RepID=UPI00142F9B08|nr:response regulator transcription factor [Maribellus sediminis]
MGKENLQEQNSNPNSNKRLNGVGKSFNFNTKGAVYWFDKQRNKAICLIDVSDVENIRLLHSKLFGSIPLNIIEIDSEVVTHFIGQLRNAEYLDEGLNNGKDYLIVLSRKLSPEKIRAEDRKLVKELMQDFHIKTTKTVLKYEGHILRFYEDYLQVSFISAREAIECSKKLDEQFNACREKIPFCKVSMKIGISFSGLVNWQIDPLDDAMHQARRMSYVADNRIMVSAAVKQQYDSESSKQLDGNRIRVLSNEEQAFITRLMDCMEEKWKDENLQVNDLGAYMNCSKSKIYRKMMELIGQSPNTFIKNYRLDRSIDLIRQKHGNISEVAFESGFGSPSYFTKCFQNRFGLNPTEYIQTIDL